MLFLMKWNLYREVPLSSSKQNARTHKLQKVYCFKGLWSEIKYWIRLIAFVSTSSNFISIRINKTYTQHYNSNFTKCIPLAVAREAQRLIELTIVTYHPSNKQIGHFMAPETVYSNLNNNIVEGHPPDRISLPPLVDLGVNPHIH